MTTKNFNVKIGITTGNVTLDAASGNANVSNVNASDTVKTNNLSVLNFVKSNLIPNANGVLSLANSAFRYKDVFLTGNIDINGQIINANGSGVTFSGNLTADGANFNSVAINNQLNINSNTDSTSTITGTIVTQGGVGIKKDLTVGGNINLATDSNSSPQGAINYNKVASSIDFKFN